jgi:DsbC/DsbD-like thiol-disulfide interchange protein
LEARIGDGLPRTVGAGEHGGPAQAIAGPVRFAVAAEPASVKLGQAFELRLTMTVAAGWRVVAAEPGLTGLLGLAVSVPSEGLALSPVRFPAAKRVRESLGAGEFNALEGESLLLVRLRYQPTAGTGEKLGRVQVPSGRGARAVCDLQTAWLRGAP